MVSVEELRTSLGSGNDIEYRGKYTNNKDIIDCDATPDNMARTPAGSKSYLSQLSYQSY